MTIRASSATQMHVRSLFKLSMLRTYNGYMSSIILVFNFRIIIPITMYLYGTFNKGFLSVSIVPSTFGTSMPFQVSYRLLPKFTMFRALAFWTHDSVVYLIINESWDYSQLFIMLAFYTETNVCTHLS